MVLESRAVNIIIDRGQAAHVQAIHHVVPKIEIEIGHGGLCACITTGTTQHTQLHNLVSSLAPESWELSDTHIIDWISRREAILVRGHDDQSRASCNGTEDCDRILVGPSATIVHSIALGAKIVARKIGSPCLVLASLQQEFTRLRLIESPTHLAPATLADPILTLAGRLRRTFTMVALAGRHGSLPVRPSHLCDISSDINCMKSQEDLCVRYGRRCSEALNY